MYSGHDWHEYTASHPLWYWIKKKCPTQNSSKCLSFEHRRRKILHNRSNYIFILIRNTSKLNFSFYKLTALILTPQGQKKSNTHIDHMAWEAPGLYLSTTIQPIYNKSWALAKCLWKRKEVIAIRHTYASPKYTWATYCLY